MKPLRLFCFVSVFFSGQGEQKTYFIISFEDMKGNLKFDKLHQFRKGNIYPIPFMMLILVFGLVNRNSIKNVILSDAKELLINT